MGNRTTRPPGRRREEPRRPSSFFLIALGLGIILLVWLFTIAVNTPMTPPTTTTQTVT